MHLQLLIYVFLGTASFLLKVAGPQFLKAGVPVF